MSGLTVFIYISPPAVPCAAGIHYNLAIVALVSTSLHVPSCIQGVSHE